MTKQKKKYNFIRLALQWAILLLLAYMVIRSSADSEYCADFEKYCPFGGLQAISGYLVTATLACSMTTVQIATAAALVLCIIVFSKLFCSFICPIGAVTEWLGKSGEKLKVRCTVKGFADRALRLPKYVLLFLTFYFTIESSELFCKKFDPYYAVFTGFGSETVIWYALASLSVVVTGSFFFRQAWCKYFCPLGAATNIFANFILFSALIIVYLLLYFAFNVNIPWYWLLAAITFFAFLKEAIFMKTMVFPLLKITRNPDNCTLCRSCDKACPMAIKVSESDRVNHIDCHLCSDCIMECPEQNVLMINRKNISRVPPLAVILLTAAALWFSSFTVLPTISDKWGSPGQMTSAKIYEQSGIKSIRCYGSSVSFAVQMKKVKGILGVETFTGNQTVKVYYNPAIITEEGVKKAVFTPSCVFLSNPEIKNIGVANMKIQNYFDDYDEYYLSLLLANNTSIYGFSTEFGEPVNAKIYFDPLKINQSQIKAVIESPELKIPGDESPVTVKLNFKAVIVEEKYSETGLTDFYKIMFPPKDDSFNKFSSYKTCDMANYKIAFTSFNKELSEQLISLESHLSNNEGITRFRTVYMNDSVFAYITFVKAKTCPATVFRLINAAKLKIFYTDGASAEIDNPFSFPEEGRVVEDF